MVEVQMTRAAEVKEEEDKGRVGRRRKVRRRWCEERDGRKVIEESYSRVR